MTQPLSVIDIEIHRHCGPGCSIGDQVKDHWYWCRRHGRAEHVNELQTEAWRHDNKGDCIRVGPFMSEREANRCNALGAYPFTGRQRSTPLGMEIET